MPYRIAGIDVHKKKLAVVVADVEVEEEYQFERRWYGSNPEQLRVLSEGTETPQVSDLCIAGDPICVNHLAVRVEHHRTLTFGDIDHGRHELVEIAGLVEYR